MADESAKAELNETEQVKEVAKNKASEIEEEEKIEIPLIQKSVQQPSDIYGYIDPTEKGSYFR